MKKLMMVMFVATAILASCSKESKLNRKLDGKWDVVSMTTAGVTMTPTEMGATSFVIEFTKDKKGVGSYTTTMVAATATETSTGTYTLTDDTKMTMTETPAAGSTSTPDVMTVNDYSKTDMTMTSTSGTVIKVKKQK
jgi:hypothetical protein